MHRYIESFLNNWKNQSERKVLLVRGARQVGKTFSIRELGNSFESFVEINFEMDVEAKQFFDGSLDPVKICPRLAVYAGKPIVPGKTLLFFDEIQACPTALQALRFFHEKMPQLHVVATGSLLEFALEEIPSFGVGRISSVFMYPLSFFEFLRVINENQLADLVENSPMRQPVDPVFHTRLLDHLRIHMILGGMPAVIERYRTSNDILSCQEVLDDLLLTIRDDFAKYKKRSPIHKLSEVFSSIAVQAGAKFKYTNVAPGHSSAGFKDALNLLVLAGLAYKIFHTSAHGVPLGGQIDSQKFKVLPLDTGIYQRIAGLSLADIIAAKPLRLINEGPLAEMYAGLQMIAGSPARKPAEVYYWHRESHASNAEVDYVISSEGKVFGIEVKAATSGRMQSLRKFLEEDGNRKGIRVSHENFATVDTIQVVPIYAVQLLSQIRIS